MNARPHTPAAQAPRSGDGAGRAVGRDSQSVGTVDQPVGRSSRPDPQSTRPSTGHRVLRSPWITVALLGVALVLNIGFYLPDPPQLPPRETVNLPHLDKLYHAGAFALTVWAVSRVLVRGSWRGMALAAGASVLHTGVIELTQAQMPHRSVDPADVAAGLVGIGIGVVLWALEQPLRREPTARTFR